MRDELQWLRMGERIKFKLSILVYKCLNNSAPPYLTDKIRPLSHDCNRSRLRSSNLADVFVPRTKTKMGDRAFEVAGPRIWNSLPATVSEKFRFFPAISQAKNRLFRANFRKISIFFM